ncbi:MAG: threonine-phosphate decarboxylase CobD [Actinobacteria bacterium]|nr:threonine-phosphate decarboxylase CobD [Actinomycetota bacterium]
MKNYVNSFKHGGNIWSKSQEYGIDINEIIDFSSNINPAGFPPQTIEIIKKNINLINKYPDPESSEFKSRLSEILNIDPKNILPGNGSSELFYLAARTVRPVKVLIPAPSFVEYEQAARSVPASCIFMNYEKKNQEFKIDLQKLIKKVSSSKLLFFCNPNNPTGSLLDREEILFLIKKCRENDCFIFIDEAFIDFVDDIPDTSVMKNIRKFSNALLFRSLTKFFAIPGIRLGYIVGSKNLIDKIRVCQPDWPLNLFAQMVGKEVISDINYISQSRQLIKKEREFLVNSLKKIKQLKLFKSAANFILIEIRDKNLSATSLADKLGRDYKILIRDCSNFRNLGNNFFRIAVKTRQENILLINSFKQIFGA